MELVNNSQINLSHKKLSVIFVIILLFIRFPLVFFAGLISFLFNNNSIIWNIIEYITYSGTYLCTVLFIYINRTRIEQFYFTFGAVFLIFLAPVGALLAKSGELATWINIALSVTFVIFIYKKKDIVLIKNSNKRIIENIILTLILCILFPLFARLLGGFNDKYTPDITVYYIVSMLLWQLSFAATFEEPLFRGFISGYLRMHGLKEWKIVLVVAALFWFAHLYYFNMGVIFWVIHPLAALLLGFLTVKTRSIAYSMVFHACCNVFIDVLQFVKLWN